MTDPAEAPKIIEVADGFFVRQEIDNIAWIDLGEYAVAVDALEQARLEKEVFAAIRSSLGGKPVKYVLNTHTHYDHVALNGAFARQFASEIINQDTTPLPAEGRWFEGTRRRVLMLPMPGCHTDEDCIVWVEPDKALFVGDIFGWGLIPLTVNLRAESEKLLMDTYQRLIDFGASTVIPGHGPLCTTAELRRWVTYYRWLVERASALSRAGKSDAQITSELAPPEDMRTWWRFLKWKHDDSVAKVLKSVRKGWVKPL
ncbi:MAG: MBL fold metallo-hydrolase [Phycisphaerae bacterium]